MRARGKYPTPTDVDLSAWEPVRRTWEQAQSRYIGSVVPPSHALSLVQSILRTQKALKTNDPLLLTPQGYAYLFEIVERNFCYARFSDLSRQERQDTLVTLGHCAYKAVRKRTSAGQVAARQWDLFAEQSIESLGHAEWRRQTLQDVLDSELSDTFKFWTFRRASMDDWLQPEIECRLRPILPQKEHARFLCLPWRGHPDCVPTNMAIVQRYCPEMYTTLCALVPDSAWVNRREMLRYTQTLIVSKNNSTLDLPDDFEMGNLAG